MGKDTRKIKKTDKKFTPFDKEEDIIEEEDELIENEEEEDLEAILEDLTSTSEDKRESACISVAELVSDPETLEFFISNGAIFKICQLLCDPEKLVRIAAAGALRNATIAGGFEISEKLVENDIMTPLMTAFYQSMKALKEDTEPALENLSQIIYLLSFLCEGCDSATEVTTNAKDIIPAFIALLTFPKCDQDLLNALAQCLLVISDENDSFLTLMNNTQQGAAIQEIAKLFADETRPMLFRVCLAGVLFNTSKEPLKVISYVSNFLLSNLSFESMSALSQIFPNLDEDKLEDQDYQKWLQFCRGQKLSIELFANMSGCVEGDGETKAILIKKLLELCEKASKINMVMITSPIVEDDLKMIESLLQVAISCVENIFFTVSPKFFEQFDISQIQNFCFSLMNRKDEELVESCTGLVWSLMPYHMISSTQAEVIAKLCFAASEETKTNCLGILGDIAHTKHTREQNLYMGKIFLAKLGDTSLKVVCKALDCIFDVYNDETWNSVVTELNMIPKLKDLAQNFESRVKGAGDMDQELLDVIEETNVNLVEFIKYKINEMK